MRTRAVLSCSEHRDYAFALPFTGLFWRLIGHEPLMLLSEIEEYWRKDSQRAILSLDALRSFDFDVRFVGHVEGYETGRIGQNAREHAAILDLPENDWLLMSDADLWPLKKSFYNQHGGNKATCLYWNGDHFQGKEIALGQIAQGKRFQTIPTCSVIMQTRTWREVYGYKNGDDLPSAIKKSIDFWMSKPGEGQDRNFWLWMCDQDLVTYLLCQMDWFPSDVQMVSRHGHPPMDRLDRGHLPDWEKIDFDKYTDAHIFKAPDRPDNWAKLRQLVAHYLPKHIDWADEYQREFRASYVE